MSEEKVSAYFEVLRDTGNILQEQFWGTSRKCRTFWKETVLEKLNNVEGETGIVMELVKCKIKDHTEV